MPNIRTLLMQSHPAVCGITEREIIVPKSKKAAIIRELKKAGKYVVGSGSAGRDTVKIWFSGTPGL